MGRFSKSSCVGTYCNRPQNLSNPFSSNNGFRHRILHLEDSILRCKELTAEWKNCHELISGDNFLIIECLQLCTDDCSFAYSLRDKLG